MAKFAIAIYIILAISMANALEVTAPSSKTIATNFGYWREFMRNPLESFQNLLKYQLDSMLDVKNRNYKIKITETDELFAKIVSNADKIRWQLENGDITVNSTLSLELAKKSMTYCKQIFLDWNNLGNALWKLYSQCRTDGMKKASLYKESLRRTEHIFTDLAEHRNMLETCINMKGISSSTNAAGCTLWVTTKLLFFYIADHTRIYTYMEASTNLEELKKGLNTGDRCINTLGEIDFYKKAKTLKSDIERCIRVVGSQGQDV